MPKSAREKAQIVVLQAYIDDSQGGSDRDFIVLAGYASTPAKWEAFSDAWDDYLRMRPVWPYLKMSERAQNPDEENWHKLKAMHRLIEEHVELEITVFVDREMHDRVLKEVRIPGPLPGHYGYVHFTPSLYHHSAISLLVVDLMDHLERDGFRHQINFVFDTQLEVMTMAQEAYHMYRASREELGRKFICDPPIFKDDKKVMPLQAADFLAWWKRRQFLSVGSASTPIREFVSPSGHYSWAPNRIIPWLYLEATEEGVREKAIRAIMSHRNNHLMDKLPPHVLM